MNRNLSSNYWVNISMFLFVGFFSGGNEGGPYLFNSMLYVLQFSFIYGTSVYVFFFTFLNFQNDHLSSVD